MSGVKLREVVHADCSPARDVFRCLQADARALLGYERFVRRRSIACDYRSLGKIGLVIYRVAAYYSFRGPGSSGGCSP